MNKKQLKIGLRQLADQGWFVDQAPDSLWEDMIAEGGTRPSDEVKKRFLAKLQTRIKAATLAGVYRPKSKRDLER